MQGAETMHTRRLSQILGNCTRETLQRLAQPVLDAYPVSVVRKPTKTLVMVRMRETVAKADFYLGEMLACEALVELQGQKGFALMAGDDLEKVLAAAVIDAACKTQLPERETLVAGLLEQERTVQAKRALELRQHAPSRVQFNTLDVTY